MSAKIEVLLGKTLSEIKNDGEVITFTLVGGEKYMLHHNQDCCETVRVEDVTGDLNDLIGSPLLKVEEATSNENPTDIKKEHQDDSFTWTFYHFATVKGYVTIRWYGESNGYYSERVDFDKISKEQKQ